MRNLITAGILMFGMAASSPTFGQNNSEEVAQLKERVAQLEKQVRELSRIVEPIKAQQAIDTRRRALRPKFEKRMALDRERHGQEELREAENLMRVADRQWGSPEAKEACDTLLKKYPDLNWSGCALLYVAQMSKGDERARYLQTCIDKNDDCFYGDGVQVGAYARFLLATDCRSKGERDKAAALSEELRTKYADAIDHGGRLLVEAVAAESK